MRHNVSNIYSWGTIKAVVTELELKTDRSVYDLDLLKVSSQSRKSEFKVFSIVHLNIDKC